MDPQKDDESEKKNESSIGGAPSALEAILSSDGAGSRVGRIIKADTILMLEDSTTKQLPDYVYSVLSQLSTQRPSQLELLSALVYCIGLEMGFAVSSSLHVLKDFKLNSFWGYSFNSINVSILSQLPVDHSQSDENVIRYSLILINYSENECNLIYLQTGEFLVITLTPNNLPGKSVCLSIPRYVHPVKRNDFAARFQNLKELSVLVKEQIFVPIRNVLLQESGLHYPGLLGLPPEILSFILKKLAMKDIFRLSKTCRLLHDQCLTFYKKKCKP